MLVQNRKKAIQTNYLFSNKDLKKLIIPLVIEQILSITVGMADTVMVASVGEAAVSGVSLVDNINILIINILSAIATGGAVVAGHYIGQKSKEKACRSAWQLFLLSGIIAVTITAGYLSFQELILTKVFGNITPEVMHNARTYLMITAISIVPLAFYNSGAALFRAMGNSKVTMWVSLIMNVINIAGNAIMIYGMGAGVEGAAIPTTISRTVAAVIIVAMLFKPKRMITLAGNITKSLRPERHMLKKILYIGIPNGLENSLFQLGKILLLSLISTFGTISIAANAVANTLTMFNILPGIAIGYAQLSVVSVCVGAGDIRQAKYYSIKLMKLTYFSIMAMSAVLFFASDTILNIYGLSPETEALALKLVLFHSIMVLTVWVPSFSLTNTFRAAGDVMVPMIIAGVSMWVFRIVAAYVFSYFFHLGLFGVWVAMIIDWCFRAILYTIRYVKGTWAKKITPSKETIKLAA